MVSLVGQTVSHYRILEHLGGGGMGVVYKAHDTRLDRPVALKFLPPSLTNDVEAKERFVHEAKAASALQHANICTIHDIDETTEGRLFIVMDFYEGETLKKKIARGPLNIDDAVATAIQVCEGLAMAHEHGIIHRDIKPANVMMTADGVAKIVDFGLAKLSWCTASTRPGTTLGTAAYMSPEQARGDPVDQRTDIWSLGVILFEMLTGNRPFQAEYENALIYSILNLDPKPLFAHHSMAPEALEKIVMKCLEKSPAARYQNVDELLTDLWSCAKQRPGPAVSSRLSLVQRQRHRRRIQVFKGLVNSVAGRAAVGILLLVLVLVMAIPGIRKGLDKIFSPSQAGQRIFVLLPFSPIDTSRESFSFCGALTSMLSSRLAQWVRDDRSVCLVNATDLRNYGVGGVEDAAKLLGASLVATGKIQRLGDIFRLTIDLIDPDGGIPHRVNSHIENYVADQYRAMEDNAVQFLATALSLKEPESVDGAGRAATQDNEAYQFYALGRGYLQKYERKANLEYAVELFLHALRKDPSFAEAYAGIGQAYWRLYETTGDTAWIARADSQMQKAMTLKPTLPEAHVAVGMMHNGTGRYEQSVADFQSALALDRANTDALRGLATAYNNLGKFAQAESTYRLGITLNPGYWAGYSYLGVYYSTRNRYEEAAAQFRRVVELAPDNIRGYNNLAAMYVVMQRWGEASGLLERAVTLGPTGTTWSLLGAAYFYEHRFAASSRAFQEGIHIDSSNYTIWGSLAGAQYWTSGEREKSIATYRRAAVLAEVARRVNPRDLRILSHLASFYAFQGERGKAMPLLEESLREGPDLVDRQERAAESFLVLGERARAIDCLEQALKGGFHPGLVRINPALSDLLKEPPIQKLIDTSDDSRH